MITGLTITDAVAPQYLVNTGVTTGGSIASNVKGHKSRKSATVAGVQTLSWTLSGSTPWAIQLVAIGPKVTAGTISYDIYHSWAQTGSDGSPASLVSNVLNTIRPSIVSYGTMGSSKMYMFWASGNHIYYKTTVDGVWGDAIDWIDESEIGLADYGRTLTTFDHADTLYDIVGVMYMNGVPDTYNVRFAYIGTLPPPVIFVPTPSFYNRGTTTIYTSG